MNSPEQHGVSSSISLHAHAGEKRGGYYGYTRTLYVPVLLSPFHKMLWESYIKQRPTPMINSNSITLYFKPYIVRSTQRRIRASFIMIYLKWVEAHAFSHTCVGVMWLMSSDASCLSRVVLPPLSRPSSSILTSWSGVLFSLRRMESNPCNC